MSDYTSHLQRNFRYFATLKPLLQLLWRTGPWPFALLALIAAIQGVIPLAILYLTSVMVDTLVEAAATAPPSAHILERFVVLIVALAGLTLLTQILGYLQRAIGQLHQLRLTNYIQTLVFEKASSLDLAYFEDPVFFNQLQNATQEASYRPVGMLTQLISIITSFIQFGSLITVILFWQAWIIPILFFASLVSSRVAMRFSTTHYHVQTGQAVLRRRANYLSMVLSDYTFAKEVRLFGLRDWLLTRYRNVLETLYGQERRVHLGEIRHQSAVELTLALIQPLLLGFTGFQVWQGALTVGQFTLYTQTISRFGGTLSQLMLQMTALHEDNLFLGNLFRFLALEPIVEAPRCSALQHPIRPHPSITFQDVSFRYPNTDRDILHQVSFTIDPGESVAVVGHNGAGKSTLVKLLTGLYEPTDGCILLDGIDIRQLDRATLRSYMSFVLQDFVIYAFSAYDNIAMGHLAEQENQERVRAAARDSNLETVIEALPQRYETIIARFLDTGVELSGGQRQSIAVARALMRQAPILIMDEPSAALDIYKERAFFEQLLTQRPDSQTVIFISHRFSTVRRANRILVLDNGALVENGTHETLLQQRGRYAEMFQLQVEMYGIEQDQKTTGDTTTMPVAVTSSIEEV